MEWGWVTILREGIISIDFLGKDGKEFLVLGLK